MTTLDISDIFSINTPLEAVGQNAPFKFYLGGSRRMEQLDIALEIPGFLDLGVTNMIVTTPDTDYDFYATYSPEVEQYLTQHGFEETDYSSAANCEESSKYEYYLLDDEAVKIMYSDSVQVVLRKDAEFYKSVLESITTDFYYHYLWKSSPACPDRSQTQPIFNALFAVARSVIAGYEQSHCERQIPPEIPY